MKYLGIDYGTKNIGVAISDDGGRVAFPLRVIDAGPGALAAIDAIIKEQHIGAVVAGESRNLKGEPNLVQEDIDAFVGDLHELSGLPVHFEREFFTSVLAARQFAPQEKSRKQNPGHKNLDASAAALLLQSFLDKLSK